MILLPDWIMPWWARPAPGSEPGWCFFDEVGNQIGDPQKQLELLHRDLGYRRGRLQIIDERGSIAAEQDAPSIRAPGA